VRSRNVSPYYSQRSVFSAFAEHARLTVQAAGRLRQLFAALGKVTDLKARITLVEHQGDEITRGAITRLRSQWITALDRPDIHLLATRLDDVLDAIEAVAERIELFDIREASPVANEAARVLESATIAVAKAVEFLPDARKTSSNCAPRSARSRARPIRCTEARSPLSSRRGVTR